MAITRTADVVVPDEFSAYIIEHSLTSTALLQSGVLVKNPFISAALAAGSTNFTVPFWRDIVDGNEADVTSD